MPSITIVMPTYNRLAQLQKVLSGLERQSHPLTDFEVVIVDELTIAAPKTKDMTAVLNAIKVGKKMVAKKATDGTEHQVEIDVTLADVSVLIGTATYDVNIYKSGRNIEGVQIMPAAEFNAYTVLKQKRLVLTKAALEVLLANK